MVTLTCGNSTHRTGECKVSLGTQETLCHKSKEAPQPRTAKQQEGIMPRVLLYSKTAQG